MRGAVEDVGHAGFQAAGDGDLHPAGLHAVGGRTGLHRSA
jgi:hypothetical protein